MTGLKLYEKSQSQGTHCLYKVRMSMKSENLASFVLILQPSQHY